MVIAPKLGIFAMLFANPLQILWDYMAVYMMRWKVQKSNPIESCQFLSFQLFMITVFCTLTLLVININVHLFRTGDNSIVLLTFLFTFLIDQIKQFGTLFVIYIVVVRRFGFLKENEKEFINPEHRA